MQVGFVSLEMGYGRAKNVRNVLLKNFANIMLCAIVWWAVGYPFAHGRTAHGFIGVTRFFQEPGTEQSGSTGVAGSADGTVGAVGLEPWFFSWTFAVSSVTIASGCLAERTALLAYPLATVLMAGWVHPVVAHWVWKANSWMHNISDCYVLDFAGGIVVHCLGGVMGLVGAALCGPRIGRFEEGRPQALPGHDVSSISLGSVMLWFGWFGFNCGSAYAYAGDSAGAVVDRVALNMTLSASVAGLLALVANSRKSGTFDLVVCCNGLLSGLVAATPSSGFVSPWASAVIGALAGLLYMPMSSLLVRLGIDDPLDASVVHLGNGVLGTLCNAAFAKPAYVQALTGSVCGGFFMSKEYGGLQLGMQLLGLAVCCAWAAFFAVLLFGGLRAANMLRVETAVELAGLDHMDHGGSAYPEFALQLNVTNFRGGAAGGGNG